MSPGVSWSFSLCLLILFKKATSSSTRQFTMSSDIASLNLSGKTYLVTGSTDGIGEHTATQLAARGANVLLHGRNAARMAQTRARILTQFPTASLKSFIYDVSNMEQTKALAADVLQTTSQLDGLVNNAGVFSESFMKTSEGLETTFAVNVAAPFILTCLLLPLLRTTPHSRILNVASISQGGKIELDNLQYECGGWSSHKSYSVSKLHMAAFSNELSRRITPDEALVMSCDPGTVNTKMLIAGWGECGIDVSIAGDELKLVTNEWTAANHGIYFVGYRKSVCSRDVNDEALRGGLWSALERITQCTIP